MRTLLAAILTLEALAQAAAEPRAAAGYALDTVRIEGAMLSGVARDGDALILTDLARGRLLRGDRDRGFVPFGPELPHGPDVIGDPTGPYRAVRVGETLIVAQGWTPADAEPGLLDHALIAVGADGTTEVISGDFWNPFDVVTNGAAIYVADAAANAVVRLKMDGSGRETIATFGRLAGAGGAMQTLSPTEFAEEEAYEVDSVPTGIALGPDGRLFVALFGGFPFLEGEGRVVSIAATASHDQRVEVVDLNAPVAVGFAGDEVLVLEHGLYDQSAGFVEGSGRLLAVDVASGDRRMLLDGLTRPVSLLVEADGAIVVTALDGNLYFLTETAE
jgi:hypothetical protein